MKVSRNEFNLLILDLQIHPEIDYWNGSRREQFIVRLNDLNSGRFNLKIDGKAMDDMIQDMRNNDYNFVPTLIEEKLRNLEL